MVSGLLERDGGEVHLNGQSMTTTTLGPKQDIGLVPQDLAVYPDLTARENLRFFGKLYSMPKAELAKRVDEVLEVVGLADRADDRADEYSGGMKRRLNIGIGLLHRPKLLVLDEPTVGVDPQSRNAILESVEHLSDEGMAVLYTTHYMEEAERLCDRVGIIDQGEIKAEGTRRELIELIGDRTASESRRVASTTAHSPTCELWRACKASHPLTVHWSCSSATREPHCPRQCGCWPRTDLAVSSVMVEEPDLEAVFLHLTGKALRD